MSKSAPWFKCYPTDYLNDTRKLTPEARGLYFDVLCLIYETDDRVPNDDAWLAFRLHVQKRTWARVKTQLLAGKFLIIRDDKLSNIRAMNEVHSRNVFRTNQAEHGKKRGTGARSVAKPATPNEATLRPASGQPAATVSHTRVQSTDKNPPTPQGGLDDVSFENGKIILRGTLHQHWLKEFGGDAARLHLALVEAAGFIQPNSRRPLEAQVSSKLARQLADKKDRDERYAKAAKTNKPSAKGDPPANFGFSRFSIRDTQDNSNPVTRYPDTSPEFMAEVDRLYQEGFVEDAERARERGWVKLKKTETIGRLAHRIAGHQMEMRKAAKE